MRITRDDYIKANRKANREAEIEDHTHPISFKRVHKSKKVYDRKRSKAENKKALPYLFFVGASKWINCKTRIHASRMGAICGIISRTAMNNG